MTWAYELGRFDVGYDVYHRYEMSRLAPGRRYRLSWAINQAIGAEFRVRVAGSRSVETVSVPDMSYTADAAPRSASVTFVAADADEVAVLRTDGTAVLQGISLREA